MDNNLILQAEEINDEVKKIDVEIDKTPSNKIFSKKVAQNINRLSQSFEVQQAQATLELFDIIEKLELTVDIAEAQNYYYIKIFHELGEFIDNMNSTTNNSDKKLIMLLLDIGKKLNINTEFYRQKLDKALVK